MRKKQKAIRWGIFLILCLLAVAVSAYVAYLKHTVPVEECSQLYRDYADNPHVTVAFIKDFPVNDTLRVDVTTLQADSDSAWCALLRDFGAPKEYVDIYKSNKNLFVGEDVNSMIMFSIDKNNPQKRLPDTDSDSRMVIGSHEKMSLCVFLADNSDLKKIIFLNETKKLKNENLIQKIGTPRSADSGRCRLPERKRCVAARRHRTDNRDHPSGLCHQWRGLSNQSCRI